MTAEPTTLGPPPEFAHLRWHWIEHAAWGDGGIRVWPREWTPQRLCWSANSTNLSPEEAIIFGWRYHGPCDPDAAARIATLTSALIASAEALEPFSVASNTSVVQDALKAPAMLTLTGLGPRMIALDPHDFERARAVRSEIEPAARAARLAAEGGKDA